MRTIDADALKDYMRKGLEDMRWLFKDNGKFAEVVTNSFCKDIDEQPTVDAVPVRHGTWKTVEDWDGDEHYQCSECGAEFVLIDGTPSDNDYLYCPHCGAKMDEKESGENDV